MPRATNNPASHNRHKKIMKMAKGAYSGRRKLFRNANETVKRGLAYAFRDRKARKREFRALWIARINAAARNEDFSYSKLIAGLAAANIDINRKMLSELAIADPAAFSEYVKQAKAALEK
ncbi:50S ribosomal protein L20 [Candidatus Sumerlaeota bacterium]|nr:50S ribosomal protein L20 [Candidatus Sumerlaeales bacterium]NLD60953.1 50S ribosomal protein L20 [Candidatus Sumerlaeota bacterium]